MKPFRTSLTARLVSVALTVALTGGGLAILSGHDALLSLALLASVALSVVALVLGIEDHAGTVVQLAIFLPVAFLPYVMVALHVQDHAPGWAWAFVAAGLVPLTATTYAPRTVKAQMPEAGEPAPAH